MRYGHFKSTVMPFGLTNASAVVMNRVCKPYLDKFVIMFIDNILIYSKSKEEQEVHFFGQVVNNSGFHVDPSKIEVVKNWKVPKIPIKIRLFFGLAGTIDVSFRTSRRLHRTWRHYLYGTKSIRYYPEKANIVVRALSRKERVKPGCLRAMAMTIKSTVKRMILASQSEAFKKENKPVERLRDLDQQMESKEDGGCTLWTNYGIHCTAYHPQTDGQSERIIQTLEDMLRACVIDFGRSWNIHLPLADFSYNNSYHLSIRCAPFKAMYGRKCRSPVLWDDVGKVAYKLSLPEELSEVHDMFHVSNLKKCLADANLHVPLEETKIEKTFVLLKNP
ncbi:putative reverse transcriptase domain-containing protein [Tanacetum coccineum]